MREIPWRVALGLAALALGSAGCAGAGGREGRARDHQGAELACSRPMPDPGLRVPPGHRLGLQLDAEGVQIYTCTATATGAAWAFTAPEAVLMGEDGILAGRHGAGPIWESLDGSSVTGAKVAGATPDPSAVPWLLLRATAHGGTGRLSGVAFVQRVATRGGVAPVEGCGAATVGAVVRVPYSASYCFHVVN